MNFMQLTIVQLTFFLMFLFLLTTSCTKVEYDLNPFTTVLNHVIKGEINGKKEKSTHN